MKNEFVKLESVFGREQEYELKETVESKRVIKLSQIENDITNIKAKLKELEDLKKDIGKL